MNNVFLEVINSVNLVNKKMNDNMKSLFSKYIKLLAVLLLSVAGVGQAWGVETTMPATGGSYSNGVLKYELTNSETTNGKIWFAQRGSVNRDAAYGWRPTQMGIVLQVSGATTLTFTVKSNTTSSRNITGQAYSITDALFYAWKNTSSASSIESYVQSVNAKAAGSRTDEEATIAASSLSSITSSSDNNKKALTGETKTAEMTNHGSSITHACPTTKGATNTFTVTLSAAGEYLIYLTSSGGSVGITSIDVASSCTSNPAEPTGFSAGSITSTGATLTWDDGANTNNYEIYYSTSSTPPTGAATTTSTAKTKAVTGLTANTTYYAWVRSVCDATYKSAWVAVAANSFTTDCNNPTQTFSNSAYTIGGSALDLSTLFSSNSSGAVTYTVQTDGGTSATIAGTSFSATTAGTATVRASQAANGAYCAKTIDATITVSATPVATYSITYDCDGAESGCPSNVAEATTLPNTLPSAPTKSGYTFDGWFTNAGKTDAAVAGATLTANVTLYAKWTAAGGGGGTLPNCGTISIDFSDSQWSGITTVANGSGSQEEVYNGVTFHSNGNKPFTINQSAGTMTWCNNNMGNEYWLAIPLSVSAGDVTITVGNGSTDLRFKYVLKAENSIGGSPGSGSDNNSSAAHPATKTIENVAAGNYTLYLGRQGSGYTTIKTITITAPCSCTPPANALAIQATKTMVDTDESSTVSVSAGTGNGGAVTYSVTTNPGGAGSVTSGGVFTASAAGTYVVTATQAAAGGVCGGTATVTISVCGESNITLSESSTSMKIGKSVDLSTKVSSHNGNLSYTVQSGGSFGTLVGSTFTGSSAGQAVVRITNTLAAPCSGSSYEDYTITVTDNCGTDLYGATITPSDGSNATVTAVGSDCSVGQKDIDKNGKMSKNGAYVLVTLTDGTYLQDGDVINVDIKTLNETSILEITSDVTGDDVLASKTAGITTGDNLITLTGVSGRNLNKFYLFRHSLSSNPVLNSVKLSRECCTAPTTALAITSSEASVVTGGTATISVTSGTGNGNTVSYSASAGTITSGGEFTAPAVATTTVVTITATQAANDKCAQVATVNVTVTPSAEPDIYVSKGGVEVPAGSSIDFSNVEIASDAATTTTETYTFSYRDDGLQELTISSIVVTGDAFTGGCGGSCPSVTNGNSSSFTVSTVSGLEPGTYKGTVTINSNDPNESPYTFNIRYVVVPKYAVTVQFKTTTGVDVADATATIAGTTTSANPDVVLVGSGLQTITCTEPAGYTFSRWQIVGGASSTSQSYEFNVTGAMTIRAVYTVSDCAVIAEAKAKTATEFTNTTGTSTPSSTSSESNSPGQYNDGETFEHAVKLGSEDAYIEVTATQAIVPGDSVIVITWASGTNKEQGFRLHDKSGREIKSKISDRFRTYRYQLEENDIESNGKLRILRATDVTRFCKIIVKHCNPNPPVNVSITPADNSNNVAVNSNVVVTLPAEFYVGTDCDNLEYIDLKTTTTAFTSAVEDEIIDNIKIYKFNEGTSSYDDVTGSFTPGAAVATAGTGVTVAFTHATPMSYTSQYRVEVQGVSNSECAVAGNISTFITGEQPLPQITVKDNGDVTTFPNDGSLNVANLMPAVASGVAVIKIYNTGTASGTLDISSMTITDDDDVNDRFTIESCTVGGASDMTPSLTKGGDPAIVTIRFAESSVMGTYHAILHIESNSTTDASFALNLIGTKIAFELPYVYESGCTDPVADPTLGVRQDYTRAGDVPGEITIGAGAEDSGADANVIPHYSLWSSLGGCSQNGESAIRVGDRNADKTIGKAIRINTGGKAIGKITVKWAANGLRKISIENAAGVPFTQSVGWETSNECHTTTAFINDCTEKGGVGTDEVYIRVYGPEDGAMAAISYLEITPCDPEIKSSSCDLINVESANQQTGTSYTAQGTDGFIAVTDNCGEGGTFTPTTLTVSNGATISPSVGVAQTINAQGYVTYVVTAADAMTKKEYHVYPECQPVLTDGESYCYASEITVNPANGGDIYYTTGEDKRIAVVATASAPSACGIVMLDENATGGNHTVHHLSVDDIPDGGYQIEGPKSVCVGSTGTYRITNAPESNSPIYTWYLPHPNEAGFAVVGSEIAYDAALTTALSDKFTPNASGYYKPQEVGEMLGIGQFVTATVNVGTDAVPNNKLMDIYSGPELKLLAPDVIESGDVSVALSLNFDFEDTNCRLLSGDAEYSIKATSRSATPIVSVNAGCADENNRLVLTASQGTGDVIEATKLDWTFSDPDVKILVASGNSATVNIGRGAPDIYATVIASNGCGTTDPNPDPIAVPYGTPATTWIGKVDNNWNNSANWTRQVPTACTDVTIAAVGETVTLPKGGNTTVSTYPVIPAAVPPATEGGICDEITFNRGAGVKGLENLSYRRAYVKNAYQRNKWYTLTNPLKEMVSGDYYFNGVPLTYMRKFDVTHSESGVTYTQKWTKEYNGLNEPLAAGQGFAYQVTSRNMRQVDNPSAGDQEVIFPRMTVDSLLITELHKFNPLNGKLLLASVNLTKTENAYRFAYDGASLEDVKTPTKSNFGSEISVPITAGAGKRSLIGNPMMCHLDLVAFLTDNESVIQPEALFWNGSTNQNIEIIKGGSVATAAPAAAGKIAPMQGFFVTNKGNGTSVRFNVADHFVTDDAGGFKLRSADALSDGTLYVTGNDGKTTSYLSVRKIEGASNGFAEGEDAEKIFNAYAVSEISTLAGGVATDINHFSALPYETPLAVNTTADKDTVDLTFKGAESFENVNVTLVNKKTGEEINLKDENKYKFIFTKDEAETTLVLRFASDEEITTDAEQAEADASGCDVQIFTKGNNTVRVMSSSSNQIREVSIYDAAGKLIAKEVATGNGVTVMDKVLNAGARNVVVTAVTDNCVKTEILQLR